jgi:hypothetical protein
MLVDFLRGALVRSDGGGFSGERGSGFGWRRAFGRCRVGRRLGCRLRELLRYARFMGASAILLRGLRSAEPSTEPSTEPSIGGYGVFGGDGFFASSNWMYCSISSWLGPTILRPFTKMVGVLDTSTD